MGESRSLDIDELTEPSKRVAAAMFGRHPEWRQWASMESDHEGWHLYVEIPSPTGIEERAVIFFMADLDDPSVGHGRDGWHTHESIDDCIVMMEDIIEDHFVQFVYLEGEYAGYSWMIDCRDRYAVLDYLTDEDTPNRVQVESWSGKIDREIDVREIREGDLGGLTGD